MNGIPYLMYVLLKNTLYVGFPDINVKLFFWFELKGTIHRRWLNRADPNTTSRVSSLSLLQEQKLLRNKHWSDGAIYSVKGARAIDIIVC